MCSKGSGPGSGLSAMMSITHRSPAPTPPPKLLDPLSPTPCRLQSLSMLQEPVPAPRVRRRSRRGLRGPVMTPVPFVRSPGCSPAVMRSDTHCFCDAGAWPHAVGPHLSHSFHTSVQQGAIPLSFFCFALLLAPLFCYPFAL